MSCCIAIGFFELPGLAGGSLYNYRSERQFRAAVERYTDFYNTKRSHEPLTLQDAKAERK